MHVLYLGMLLNVAHAAYLQINNGCLEDLYLLGSNTTATSTEHLKLGPAVAVAYGEILGSGNSLVIAKSPDFYTTAIPKFVLGLTELNGKLWWSVGNRDGIPFDAMAWNVTTDGACGEETTYGGVNHNCEDGDFTLSVNVYC